MGERCKVGRVIKRYGLDGEDGSIDETLLHRWQGDDDHDSQGYRTLTDWFNRRILKQVYDQHSRTTMAARLKTDYDLLVGDDDLARDELLADLERDGIDGERVHRDLISWSTMRHHLQGCLDGEKPTQESDADWEADSIEATQESALSRIQKILRSLDSKDKLPGANDAQVSIEFRLSCPECPTRVPLNTALDRGYICRDHLY